jgi:ectoine hydroxylase-related dioxygenase (phytanoyl-CoA dioxygenase family)
MVTVEALPQHIREVTEGEVEHYADLGWVHLPGLLSADLAAALLVKAQDWMGEGGDEHPWRRSRPPFQTYEKPSREDPLFEAICLRSTLGLSLARLLGREETGITLLDDTLQAKLPNEGDPPTPVHQDGAFLPLDRPSANLWIALDDVSPDMGMMRFRSGSQAMGSLGRNQYPTMEEALAAWPRIARYPSEGPAHLAPGDATVHASFTIHSAPANSTGRTRWSYLLNTFPSDTRWLYPHRSTEGLELEHFQVLEHERFPPMYAPA